MKFSVLMSIYYKEEVQNFNRAMQSVWDEQTVKPNEVVLVEDGPLTDELYQAIEEWKERLAIVIFTSSILGIITHIQYPRFLIHCRHMINRTSAFGKCQFEFNETQIISYRRTPEQHNEIAAFAKGRSPVNHVTAMYKKSCTIIITIFFYFLIIHKKSLTVFLSF
jgi:hypothetical protein